MANFGLGQYCHRVDDIRPAVVVEDVHDVASLTEVLAPLLRETNERYIRAIEAQFGEVFLGAQPPIPRGASLLDTAEGETR
jgi:hypothetical protein